MLTVTLYLPSGTFAPMKPVSTPQPRWMPQAFASSNGSDWHCCGKRDLAGAFGLERCGEKLSGQNAPTCDATIFPAAFFTVTLMKRCRPAQLLTVQSGSGRRMVAPPGVRMIWLLVSGLA